MKKKRVDMFVDPFFFFLWENHQHFRVRGKEFRGFHKAKQGAGGSTTRKDAKRVCNLLEYITDC